MNKNVKPRRSSFGSIRHYTGLSVARPSITAFPCARSSRTRSTRICGTVVRASLSMLLRPRHSLNKKRPRLGRSQGRIKAVLRRRLET
jgi:hypothetical protein